MERYDIAIAGGGPAGSAAAIALAREGLRVLVADAAPPNAFKTRAFKIGEGLPPNARSLLRELRIAEPALAACTVPSYGTLAAWGSHTLHANDTLFGVHGAGYSLDRAAFDATLRDAAAAAGAEIVGDARLVLVDDAARDDVRLTLRTSNGERAIRCRRAIDAGGRAASLSRRAGAARHRDDALVAFYLRLAATRDGDASGSTLVEAVPDGWWYSVRLPRGGRLVAFLGDAPDADRRRLLSVDGLWSKLGETTHLQALCAAHGYRPNGTPRGADASGGRLDRAAGDGWLAVGDAALAFDPLSSKGIANALYTGLAGARATRAVLAGDEAAAAGYAAHVAAIHAAYRAQLAQIYALETRWPHAPFWRRRQTVPDRAHRSPSTAPDSP
ncbi:tryptophan 7-halogenase, partial [Tahibacter soli]